MMLSYYLELFSEMITEMFWLTIFMCNLLLFFFSTIFAILIFFEACPIANSSVILMFEILFLTNAIVIIDRIFTRDSYPFFPRNFDEENDRDSLKVGIYYTSLPFAIYWGIKYLREK